jgi:DNA-binding NtrC family response regulator
MDRNSDTGTVVLLVDDEEDFLAATARVLARRGLKVLTAITAEEALEVLDDRPVDVVVLDLKMPGMGGERAFAHIKESFPTLPVIMLTGHGSIPQAFEMSKGGVFDFLAKPCDADALTDIVRAAAAAREVTAPEARAPTASERIAVLIIDDEPELLDSLKQVLGRRGMEVITARSGEWALELLASRRVDVVVLDVKMPGMGGIETLQRIKAASPDLEVILLTGHPNVSSAVSGTRLGAMEYVTKPPDVAALTDLIRRADEKRRAALERRRQEEIRSVLDRQPD